MAKKAAEQMNDEFDILGLGADGEKKPEVAAKPKNGAAKVLDPEDDRENWPTIMINAEDGKPNYETVIVHGTKQDGTPFGHDLQIMRGTPVKVPPSIVYCLQDAIATHHVPSRDPKTGKPMLIRQDRPSVSWNLIDRGKYIK